MCHNVPVERTAELYGVNYKTAFERRHRALTMVFGYRDRIVMRNTVWVDETYISDTDLSKGCVPSSKNRQIRLSNFDTLMLTASGRAGAVAAGPPAA